MNKSTNQEIARAIKRLAGDITSSTAKDVLVRKTSASAFPTDTPFPNPVIYVSKNPRLCRYMTVKILFHIRYETLGVLEAYEIREEMLNQCDALMKAILSGVGGATSCERQDSIFEQKDVGNDALSDVYIETSVFYRIYEI